MRNTRRSFIGGMVALPALWSSAMAGDELPPAHLAILRPAPTTIKPCCAITPPFRITKFARIASAICRI
jgi:hypothetical protein